MTYNLKNNVTAAFAALLTAAVFVSASVAPAANAAASLIV